MASASINASAWVKQEHPLYTQWAPVWSKLGEAYEGDGLQVNSAQFDGLSNTEAKEKIALWMEEKNIGKYFQLI